MGWVKIAVLTAVGFLTTLPAGADERLSAAPQLAASTAAAAEERAPKRDVDFALVCFATGQQVSGIIGICYYNCAGSAAAITISIAQVCPISIER